MAAKSAEAHNETVYLDLEVGDLVEFKRGLYSHWAVFIGNGEVIHLSGEEDDGLGAVESKHVFTISGVRFNKAVVRKDKFWDVAGEDKAYKNNTKDKKWKAYRPQEIVKRAISKLGRIGYNLVFSNCEHFAAWCRYNVERSDQVDSYLTGLAVGTAVALTAGAVAWFSGGSSDDKKKEKKSEY